MTGFGKGFGKTILFGEHFVVYGLPGIVAGLSYFTTAKTERIEGTSYELVDERLETPGYKAEKLEEQKKSIENIFQAMNFHPAETPIKIILGGNLTASSGVGASAASCIAIARAINDDLRLNLSDEQINAIGFEGEKGYHGTPSGIDNTAATYGGVLSFKKNPENGNPVFEKLKIGKPFELVIANTGITSSTAQAVGDVKKFNEKNSQRFEEILKEYDGIYSKAKEAIQAGAMVLLGNQFNENQKLLHEITVSSNELENLIEISLKNGALGAKLTGTGKGGLMIALTPGKELQSQVSNALEEKGITTIKTTIGAQPPAKRR